MQLFCQNEKQTKIIDSILSILNVPSKSQLKLMKKEENQIQLYFYQPKKLIMALSKVEIQKSKLLTNLQIFEWRKNTEFPIVKTHFVDLKTTEAKSGNSVLMNMFYEYCPLRLTQIYQIPLGQSLYLLKQSLVGFQRLFNKFGACQIQNSMIAINQKGYCKVWVNNDFCSNGFNKRNFSEDIMVNKIINLLQSHTQQSRNAKKLFNSLKTSSTFLKSLKIIEDFIKQTKVFVPTRFFKPAKKSKQISKTQNLNGFQVKHIKISESPCKKQHRFSINQQINEKQFLIKEQDNQNIRQRKKSFSPITIKRFKSEKQLEDFKMVKTSKETAETGTNNRSSKIVPTFNSPRQTLQIFHIKNRQCAYSFQKRSRKNTQGNIQQINQLKYKKNWHKKQLTHSQGLNSNQITCSFNLYNQSARLRPPSQNHQNGLTNMKNSGEKNAKYQYYTKYDMNQPYFQQFEQLLNQSYVSDQAQENSGQYQKQIIKNNGWKQKILELQSPLLKCEKSLIIGQKQPKRNIYSPSKLTNMLKNPMQMSILFQEVQDQF